MYKVMVSGRGGSGKSTLTALLAGELSERGRVLVVDTDESNLGLVKMLGLEPPARTLINCLGGKPAVGKKLLASLQQGEGERASLFAGDMTMDALPGECACWARSLGYLLVGKIEQSMEGCACPMGAVARSFLKQLEVSEGQWVIVDTEAGVEHFGRGVLEGADMVIAVVDPSHEAVLLAEKAGKMASQAKKPFAAVLNKVDHETEGYLKKELAARGIPVAGAIARSPGIEQANLIGSFLDAGELRGSLSELTNRLAGLVENKK